MKRDLGPLWHALAGLVVAGAATLAGGPVPGAIAIGACLMVGVAREWWQHDLTLSAWQWGEALAWPGGALVGLALCLAVDARAADPECQGATPADPAAVYDASAGIRLCAPTLDASGDPLLPEEITACRVLLDGVLYAEAPASPGEYLEISPPSGGAKIRALAAYCTGPAGDGALSDVYSARVRRGKPGRPVLR